MSEININPEAVSRMMGNYADRSSNDLRAALTEAQAARDAVASEFEVAKIELATTRKELSAALAEVARLRLEVQHALDTADAAIAGQKAAEAERDAALAENSRLREALTPSAETKFAYIGEFSFTVPDSDEDGGEIYRKVMVPWTSVKEIMRAISDRAALRGSSHE